MLPLQNFKTYINQYALFTERDKILLAVSGGKDSVLMAHLFKLSGFDFGIAHCNFNLRADESQRDETFVKMLASTLDVPFYVTHFKTKEFAATHKVSTQMAARTLRYEWFEKIRLREQYDYIALAQHQDDAVETVLLNLTRGTGIAGLHGILPKRDKLIRPLLFLSAADIAGLIHKEHIEYVEDSSNLSTNYARNKIRLNVIPYLKEINPNLDETFRHNIQRFADTELVLQQVVATLKEKIVKERQGKFYLSIKDIKELSPRHLLLFELLRPFGFLEPVVAELLEGLDKQSGTTFFSVSHRVIVDREQLIIDSVADQASAVKNVLIHPDLEAVEFLGSRITITQSADLNFKKNSSMAYVDADKLIFPLILRSWQHGDKFKPIGMNSYKKLSDFFIDEKVPLSEKNKIPVLINGNGELIWIAGWRQDNRYKLTENTRHVTIFELRNLHITITKQS
ncbi:tRNA lysidine(34) synthetase TilS [Pedobacter nyackensis]|uniref:tRNA lysidine(34) synthetase TilS n=1 Tax=Pedobacter nyackensis TaxID=475255 RepID=UPI00292FC837|nr:tRNA lysidine(34) synthetase TilS [Pedobacter nyackensis]